MTFKFMRKHNEKDNDKIDREIKLLKKLEDNGLQAINNPILVLNEDEQCYIQELVLIRTKKMDKWVKGMIYVTSENITITTGVSYIDNPISEIKGYELNKTYLAFNNIGKSSLKILMDDKTYYITCDNLNLLKKQLDLIFLKQKQIS